jgi:hypothetical protein
MTPLELKRKILYVLHYIVVLFEIIGIILKKTWRFLDGKKTILASVYWLIYNGILPIWIPLQQIPYPWKELLLSFGVIFTTLGLGHKGAKKVEKSIQHNKK